jgi:hypothetical protein
MVATSRPAAVLVTVAAATASSDAGRLRCRRGTTAITATTSTTMPAAASCPDDRASRTAWAATTAVFSPSGRATPRAMGTCWRKMITAMPTVKPSTTGQGTNAR